MPRQLARQLVGAQSVLHVEILDMNKRPISTRCGACAVRVDVTGRAETDNLGAVLADDAQRTRGEVATGSEADHAQCATDNGNVMDRTADNILECAADRAGHALDP